MATENENIFSQCNKILIGVNDNTMFNYEVDGLIFTPADKSVASSSIVSNIPTTKITWQHSFKWKPPKYKHNRFPSNYKKK